MLLHDRIRHSLNSLWKAHSELQEMMGRYGTDPSLADLSILRAQMGKVEKQATHVGLLLASWEGAVSLHRPEEEVIEEGVEDVPLKDYLDVLVEQIPDPSPAPAPAEPPDLTGLKQWASGEIDPTGGLPEEIPGQLKEPKKVEKPPKTAGRALHELEQIAGEEDPDKKTLIALAVECLELGMSANHTRLVKVLRPHLALLTREKRLKGVRKAIRDYEKEITREADVADKDNDVLPDDWPFWKYTEGKSIAIVGGDRREATVERFKEAFRANSVEWESGWQVRRVESLASRIESGSIDLVIMLARFMSHQAWYILVPSTKVSKVPFVLVERGYGLSHVRHTVENVLERWNGRTR